MELHSYRAYGLAIDSMLPLPELVAESAARADVCITLGEVACPLRRTAAIDHCFHVTATEVCFWWEQVGAFRVRDGNEITVELVPGVEERLVRLPLLGIVMAVLLHQRGLLVLHGSAIALDGSAVVFLGGKGYGKSTAAATLYGRGHFLLADDMVALDLSGAGEPTVLPGFPQLKLWPEAAASALGDDPEMLPRLAADYEKRARPVRERFSGMPLPLKCIYALAEGQAPTLERLRPGGAVLPVITHSYVARLGSRLLHGEQGSAHFRRCTNLVQRVPVYTLERPRLLPLLEAVAQLVEEHITPEKQTV